MRFRFRKLGILVLSLCVLLSGIALAQAESPAEVPFVRDTPVQGLGTVPQGGAQPPNDVYTYTPADASGSGITAFRVTAQAYPDNTIAIYGDGFTGESRVFVYSQTTADDGILQEAEIIAGDNKVLNAILPANLPYGAYGVYVQNGDAITDTLYINTAQVWWIGQTMAAPGGAVSVYGANLTQANGAETSYVYLRPYGEDASAAPVQAEVVEANPYKVTFLVPEALEDEKTYEVWVHNGHGGDQGWAYAPQALYVSHLPVMAWNGAVRNVVDYGASPADDGGDDTQAIKAAIEAAQTGDTIFFPAGTYLITDEISVVKELCFRGEGAKESTVQMHPAFAKTALFNIISTPFEIENIGFISVTDIQANPPFILIKGDSYPLSTTGFSVHDCYFEKTHTEGHIDESVCIIAYNVYNVSITNNEFLAPAGMVAFGLQKVFITGNTVTGNFLNGRYNGPQSFHLRDCRMVDESGNTFTGLDYFQDPDGRLDIGDATINRSVVFQGYGSELYVADNTMRRVGTPYDNSGEQIMMEAPASTYVGRADDYTETTMTLPQEAPLPNKGSVITILAGKGQGQYRTVASAKKGVVTLADAWAVTPDETSLLAFVEPFENVAVYNNDIDGFTNYYELENATAGIQAYGNHLNYWVSHNVFKNLHTGIRLTAHVNRDGYEGHDIDVYNHFAATIVQDNHIENTRKGIMVLLTPYGGEAVPEPQNSTFSTVIRNNTLVNMMEAETEMLRGIGGNAITVGTKLRGYTIWPEEPVLEGPWVFGTIVEGNTIRDCAGAPILLEQHQEMTIIRNNTVTGNNAETPVGYEAPAKEAAYNDMKTE